jgi:hypothetical protein
VDIDWALVTTFLRLPEEAAPELVVVTATLGQVGHIGGRDPFVASLLGRLPGSEDWEIEGI